MVGYHGNWEQQSAVFMQRLHPWKSHGARLLGDHFQACEQQEGKQEKSTCPGFGLNPSPLFSPLGSSLQALVQA